MIYIVVGIFVAEALTWCVLLPSLHHQYTTGIATNQLWKPVLLLALVGAGLGFGAFRIRSALKGS